MGEYPTVFSEESRLSKIVLRWKALGRTGHSRLFDVCPYDGLALFPADVVAELKTSTANPLISFRAVEGGELIQWEFENIGPPNISANHIRYVWVYRAGDRRPGLAVFDEFRAGALWIRKHGLTGILKHYPMNQGEYDWQEEHCGLSRGQVGFGNDGLISASLKHEVFQDGQCLSWPEYYTLDETTARSEAEERFIYYPSFRKG